MRGHNTLLMGPSGVGKTYSLRTTPQDITTCIIFTEPGEAAIEDVPCPRLHYHYVPTSNPSLESLLSLAKTINERSFESLTRAKTSPDKKEYTQWLQFLTSLISFKCDRCGEELGNVGEWRTDKHLVIDSLSGLNIMALDLAVGSKPVPAIGEWGIAMDNEERIINKLTTSTECHFTLITHLTRTVDEIAGGLHLANDALGNKLAHKIPRFFDEVVMAIRKGKEFYWSTIETNADTKARNLPLGEKLAPSFSQILKRG